MHYDAQARHWAGPPKGERVYSSAAVPAEATTIHRGVQERKKACKVAAYDRDQDLREH